MTPMATALIMPGETNLASFEIDLVQDVNSNGVGGFRRAVVASVTTATNGNYSFAGITPVIYVIPRRFLTLLTTVIAGPN